jgi:hypothetical protein
LHCTYVRINLAEKTKELTHKLLEILAATVNIGRKSDVTEVEENLAELEKKRRRHQLRDEALDDKMKITAQKVSRTKQRYSEATKEMAEIEEIIRQNKLEELILENERTNVAEKIVILNIKQREQMEHLIHLYAEIITC